MPRRLAPTIYAIVFVDVFMQFAIVPLLPSFSRLADLSKFEAGLVVAVYSGAVLVASLPVGRLTDRLGARRLTICGVVLLALSVGLNAFATNFAELMLVRLGQGISSAISWTAAIAWLTASAPLDRRARVLTSTMAAATIGSLLGPVVAGPLAERLGLHAPFAIFAAVSAVLAVIALQLPEGRGQGELPVSLREVLRIAGNGGVLSAALALMLIVSAVSGALETLVPLALGRAGHSATAISLVLGATGVLAVVTNAAVGRGYARFGGVAIGTAAAVAAAAGAAAMAIPAGAVTVAVIFICMSPAITAQYAVEFPLAAEGADAEGLPHGVVMGLLNVVWGAGFLVGPAAGAALAEVAGDRATYVAAAAISLAGAVWLRSLALLPVECQDRA